MSDTSNTGGTNSGSASGSASGSTWRNNPTAAYAYDPWLQPDLFAGVLTKRFFAFLIDLVVLSIPIVLISIFILIFGVITLGLGWLLFGLISPVAVIWALVYYGASLGGVHGATVGMRTMGIQMRTRTGDRPYFMLGAIHAILYWLSVSFLTPFIVLVGLFNGRRQLLHDMILGTVIVNTHANPGPVVQTARV
jgi:uncharacterized RDD family membrane protein YckC